VCILGIPLSLTPDRRSPDVGALAGVLVFLQRKTTSEVTLTSNFLMFLRLKDGRYALFIFMTSLSGEHLIQTILHYMVSSGSGQNPTKPSVRVLFLLQRSGLMTTVGYVRYNDYPIWMISQVSLDKALCR